MRAAMPSSSHTRRRRRLAATAGARALWAGGLTCADTLLLLASFNQSSGITCCGRLQGQALREWLGGHLSHRQENEGHRRQMLRGQGVGTLYSTPVDAFTAAERCLVADHGEWVESIAAALEAASISTVPQLMEYQRTDEALAGCATPA